MTRIYGTSERILGSSPARELEPEGALILRVLVEEGQYNLLHGLIRKDYLQWPFANFYSLKSALESLSPLESAVMSLFGLGEALPEERLKDVLGGDTIGDLVETGLLTSAGGALQSRYLLVPHLNKYYLASPPPGHPRYDRRKNLVYIGPESFWMGQLLANYGPFHNALDLCAGTGFLAGLVEAERVSAVELDLEAVAVARFNAALNRQEHVRVLTGDLYEPVSDENFDLVVANPPFLPVPEGLDFPVCGDGGPLGDRVIKRVVGGLAERLAPHGQAFVYGEGFGGPSEPDLASWLRANLPSDAFDFSLYINSTQGPDAVSWRLTSVWQATGVDEKHAWDAWRTLSREVDFAHYHSFLMKLRPGGGRVSVNHVPRVGGART